MARNDVYLNINALSPADAVVTGQQDMTAATVPELVLGDTPTFNFYFTDNTNVWPSWAGNASYSLTWALSDAVAGDFSPAATTGNATPITGGWSVILPLNSYDLVGLLNTKRVGQPYPVTNLWQQLRVTDPSGNEITRAMFWTPVRYRAISDTQNTESASPTGGRFVTVNNVNTLTTPTAAQFYAANPVPTSALGTAANGELLIGNATGFTKATLTAGTGVSITNGSGSITISATDGDITLDDGTAAAPSLKFTSDTDTGLYRPAANTLGVAVGGAQVAYFDANGITTVGAGATFDGSVHAANGNANNPSLSFTSDDNTGFFRHQADEIGITLGGTQKATLTSTTFSITPNLSTSGNLTVSGGTITGGTSGLSLASGGTNQNITLTPSGTGAVAITGISNGSNALTASTGTVNLALNLSSGSTGAAFGTTSAHAVSFITSNVVRGMFASTGNLLIGTTTDGGQKLQVSGTAIVSSTAASTSTTTGALVVGGGAGIGAAIYCGDKGNFQSGVRLGSSYSALDVATGASGLYLSGSQGALDHILINNSGQVQVLKTTASTSTTTGALVVSGGVGVAGAVNVGGAISIGNTVNTVSPTSPNRTITMVIGGTTYYIHAKTTND